MGLEWDEEKRQRTKRERGLDFMDLARYDWLSAADREDPRDYGGEKRRVSVGYLHGRLIVVAYTIRGDNHRTISMRLASKKERKDYG